MKDVKLFQSSQICSIWNDEASEWFFSVVDIVGTLTDSADKSAYWRKLKQKLKAEGSETVTNCHRLKLQADDGKMRLTDTTNTEGILRIIQSIPSDIRYNCKGQTFLTLSCFYAKLLVTEALVVSDVGSTP